MECILSPFLCKLQNHSRIRLFLCHMKNKTTTNNKTMKTTLITLSIVAFAFSANAQKVNEADVPAAVKAKQASLYPNAKVEKWEKEDANFEAEFDNGKVETSTLFDTNGNLLET